MKPGSVLRHYLNQDSRFPNGSLKVRYPTGQIDLRTPLAGYVVNGGFTAQPLPFESLHERVARQHTAWGRDAATPGVNSDFICQKTPALLNEYHKLIKFLAHEVLGFDFMFEDPPNVRFHFPGGLNDGMPDRYRSKDGELLAQHSDTLFGDPFEQINCWLPLGTCFGQNTLQWAPLDVSLDILNDFCEGIGFSEEAYVTQGRPLFFGRLADDPKFRAKVLEHSSPLVAEYGEIILFDPRIVHGTSENTDDHTRVSSDFRLLPLGDFESMKVRGMASLSPEPTEWAQDLYLEKVEFYDRRTAYEL